MAWYNGRPPQPGDEVIGPLGERWEYVDADRQWRLDLRNLAVRIPQLRWPVPPAHLRRHAHAKDDPDATIMAQIAQLYQQGQAITLKMTARHVHVGQVRLRRMLVTAGWSLTGHGKNAAWHPPAEAYDGTRNDCC